MNIARKNVALAFLLALIPFLIIPAVVPSLRLTFFAPFLIIAFYRLSLTASLWVAFGCGLIVDILASHHRIGLYSLNYSLTTLLLYSRKQNFFADNLTTLPLMTFFFALISTLLQLLVLQLSGKGLALTLPWALTDLIVMPLCDAAYAFALFILPSFLWQKTPLKGEDYFQE